VTSWRISRSRDWTCPSSSSAAWCQASSWAWSSSAPPAGQAGVVQRREEAVDLAPRDRRQGEGDLERVLGQAAVQVVDEHHDPLPAALHELGEGVL
jgi:hypothetical protein